MINLLDRYGLNSVKAVLISISKHSFIEISHEMLDMKY